MSSGPGRCPRIAPILCAVLASCAATGPEPELSEPTPREAALAFNARLHVEKLAGEIGPRSRTDHESLTRTIRYISAELTRAGLEVREHAFTSGGETSINVEGRTPSGPGARTLIVGAHYDTVRASPGANDNASGVAAMIELARLVNQRKLGSCSYRFVSFGREEDGLLGSRAYARELAENGVDVRAMLSIDSLGYYSDAPGSQREARGVRRAPRKANFVTFVSNKASEQAMQAAAAGFRKIASIPLLTLAASTAIAPDVVRSDHAAFWTYDVPAFLVTDTGPLRDSAYHRPGDMPDRLDFDRLGRAIAGLELALRSLEKEVCGTTPA